MPKDYIMTTEEMEASLLNKYGKIPRGSIEAYNLLREKTGLGINNKNNEELPYTEKVKLHKDICKLLGFSPEGGLAGRNMGEF